MHLLGRSITVVANKGTARERTILSIPVWDFDNQSARPLAKPLPLQSGDTVTVTCTHDPGLRKLLPELQGTPDRYVVWGEGTTDEMCLGILITS
jgi:protein involved in polysaccharide export with SLBB domain